MLQSDLCPKVACLTNFIIMITLELTPYDSLLVNLDKDGNISSFNSDVSLLQRADVLSMLPQSVNSLVDNNASHSPYDGMSDEDIISHTRSRRIQSPSELSDWSKSLELESKIEVSKLKSKSKSSKTPVKTDSSSSPIDDISKSE